MKEIDFQHHLIKAAQRDAGYGLKLSNAYQAGVPDLLIKLIDHPVAIIECKVIKVAKIDMAKSYVNSATKLQKETLTDMLLAGMMVGLVVLVEDGTAHHDKIILATPKFGIPNLFMNDQPILKEFRKPWPILKIIRQLSTTLAKPTGR